MSGALTTLFVFSPDSTPSWPTLPPSTLADSLGQFSLMWDGLESGTIDSVGVETLAPGAHITDKSP